MKKVLVLVTVAMLAIFLVAGCGGGVKTYTDSGQAISIGVNQEFAIALGSNPTTGYEWQESHDNTMLELVERTYQPGEEAKQDMVGTGGVEYYRFKALKTGKTEITMDYKRAWEKEVADHKVFTVNIE